MRHHSLVRSLGWLSWTGWLLLLALSVPAAETNLSSSQKLPSPRQVLEKYLQAIGGRKALLSHQSARIKGRFEFRELGLEGLFEIQSMAPNLRVLRIDLDHYGRILQGYDGRNGWAREAQQDIQIIQGYALEQIRDTADFYAELHQNHRFRSMKTIGLTNLHSRPVYHVKLFYQSGRQISKFFDQTTGLLLTSEEREPGQPPLIKSFQNYREFDGLKFPTHETQSSQGRLQYVVTVTEVTFDNVSKDVFPMDQYRHQRNPKAFPTPKKNQPGRADKVDRLILKAMKEQGIPGLAVAVVQQGKPVKIGTYGWANLKTKQPVTDQTLFPLCALTKAMTASGILFLVEEGKVSLKDPLVKFIPNIPFEWDDITIEQLLTHTSGLGREPYGWNALSHDDPATVLEAAKAAAMIDQPGQQWAYSNTGYYLLGMVINKASQQSWSDFLKDKIFTPLDMKQTGLIPSDPDHRAQGYLLSQDGAPVTGHRETSRAVNAASGLYATLADLIRWEQALQARTLLSPLSQELSWTRAKVKSGESIGYGFGWFLNESKQGKVVEHSGGNREGIRVMISRFPAEKLTVLLWCNWARATPQSLTHAIADHYR